MLWIWSAFFTTTYIKLFPYRYNIYVLTFDIVVLAGQNNTRNKSNRALGAKFFKFGMVVGMGVKVSKTIANKLWSRPGGHLG